MRLVIIAALSGFFVCLAYALAPLAPQYFESGIPLVLNDSVVFHQQALASSQQSFSTILSFFFVDFINSFFSLIYKISPIKHPIILGLFQGLVGAIGVSRLYLATKLVTKENLKYVIVALTLALVTPSFMSIMAYPTKDIFIFAGIASLFCSLMMLAERFRIKECIFGTIAIALVCTVKPHFSQLLAVAIVLVLLSLVFHDHKKKTGVLLLLIVSFAAIYFLHDQSKRDKHYDTMLAAPTAVTQASQWTEVTSVRQVEKLGKKIAAIRAAMVAENTHANTPIALDVEFKDVREIVLYIPEALRVMFFEPTPWREIRGSSKLSHLAFLFLKWEMVLFWLSLVGLIFIKNNKRVLFLLFAYLLPFFTLIGLIVANIGTANRYRLPFILTLKVFGLVGGMVFLRGQWEKLKRKPERAKKILLFLVPDDRTFIIQRLVMARAGLAGGYEVHVACPDFGYAQQIRDLGFVLHEIDLNRGSMNPLRDITVFWKLIVFLWKLRPDILHNVSIKPVIYGSAAGTIVGLKRIVNLVNGLGYAFERQGFKGKFVHFIVVSLYRNALALPGVRVIFQNPDDRAYFVDHEMVEEAKTLLIRGSGVDRTKFAPTPAPPTENPTVLFVGRLLWSKGIRELIQAAEMLRKENIKFRLMIVGEPDPCNPEAVPVEVLKEWHEKGLIEWMGRQSDMPKFYRLADIVCLPTSYREGLPLTLIEAASVGRPLVATDIPGCREVVRNGVNGFLVPPKNSAALAGALKELLLSADLRAKYGAASSLIVHNEFSSEKVQEQLLAVYSSLMEPK